MKKLISMLLIIFMLSVSFVGCDDSKSDDIDGERESRAATTTEVAATLPHLQDSTQSTTNTRVFGKVSIILDESELDEYGTPTGGRTEEGNTYELIPGLTYVKAPTITVLAGSDSCYVFFAISIDDEIANVLDKSKNVIATQLQANGWLELQDSNKVQIVWTYKGGRAFNVYYKADAVPASSVDQTLATFEKFSVAEGATYDDLSKVVGARITTHAFAVWSDAFDTPQAAWDGTFKQVSG